MLAADRTFDVRPGEILLSIASLLTLDMVVYLVCIVFPWFDFNVIEWLNAVKHVTYRLLILFLVFASLLHMTYHQNRLSWPTTGIEAALAMYLFSIVNSVFWATSFSSRPLGQSLIAVASMLLLVMFVYAMLYWLNTPAKVRRANLLMLYTGFALSLFGLFQAAVGWYSLYHRPGTRLAGIFWDSNIYARYELILLFFALSVLFIAKPAGKLRRRFLWIAVVSFLGLLLTFSRSGYVALAVLVLPFFYSYIPKRYLPAVIVGMAAFCIGGFVLLSQTRATGGGSAFIEASSLNRVILMAVGILMIKAHWLAGVGFGGYTDALWEMMGGTSGFFTQMNMYSIGSASAIHNWLIEVWAEQGIIGVIGFLSLFVALIRRLRHASKLCDDPWMTALLRGHIFALLVFLVHGLFYHTFISQFFFWVYVALALATVKAAKATGPWKNLTMERIGSS